MANNGVSSVLRTAASLSKQTQQLEDDTMSQNFSMSLKTSEDLAMYSSYLSSRIKQEQNSNTISGAVKALQLQNTLVSAVKSNGSADIQRENIQIMAGNATLRDKYNIIVQQYGRAVALGDLSLAQNLESQAYSVNQSIQYQDQQARDAAATISKAAVTYQGDIVTGLTNAIKEFEGVAKNASEQELNATLKGWVQKNGDTLKTLGVNVATDQPNYWDVVGGVIGAIYNHTVLKAQAEAPINAQSAQNYAYDALFINQGITKFQTLGGQMSFQEIQQASQDPSMFAYDTSTGSFKRTTQTGYQYQNFIDATGKAYTDLVPTYSGMVAKTVQGGDNVYFLNPNQTATMHKLNLNFSENTSGKNVGTTGNGVEVQLSENSPQWLKSLMGENGVTNFYTDSNGNLVFKGPSVTKDSSGNYQLGAGDSYYTLSTDATGRSGVFEHLPDGSSMLAGADAGFNSGAASLLLNTRPQLPQISQNTSQAPDLKLATPPTLPPISQPAPTALPNISVPKLTPPAIVPKTVNPQPGGTNPQPGANSPQNASGGMQGGGFDLMSSGGGGIKL